MNLFDLPSEIVIRIFEFVGSSYFRSHPARARVSRLWSQFARLVWFQELYLSQERLQRLHLLSCSSVETSLPHVQENLEVLNLRLEGFTDWRSFDSSSWDSDRGRALILWWTQELDKDLLYLTTIIQRSRRLRTLRIKATGKSQPGYLEDRNDYLFQPTIHTILTSVGNLTNLELDLRGTELVHQEHDEGSHFCTNIAALFTTLRRLRLRMRRICTDVLKPQKRVTGSNLRLEEILIDLSVPVELADGEFVEEATCCKSLPESGGYLQLKEEMENEAQVLVTQMKTPKTARILSYEILDNERYAFDVLTGRNSRLDERAEWGYDGEIIQDEVSDEGAGWDDDDGTIQNKVSDEESGIPGFPFADWIEF